MVFDAVKGESRAKKILKGVLDTGRLPGAYLFNGDNTGEMMYFAKDLAKHLNCAEFCGDCINCRRIERETHPALIIVRPEGKKGVIKIDRIRQLKDQIKYGPAEGSWAVIVFAGADLMEQAAANSLLKVLEEPPDRVLFILISQRRDSIPKTVLSRCQPVFFTNPGTEETGNVDLFKANDVPSLMDFSASISDTGKENERSDVEKRLKGLLNIYWNKRSVRETKAVLKTIVDIKKMANIRLSVDRMALKLAGVINE